MESLNPNIRLLQAADAEKQSRGLAVARKYLEKHHGPMTDAEWAALIAPQITPRPAEDDPQPDIFTLGWYFWAYRDEQRRLEALFAITDPLALLTKLEKWPRGWASDTQQIRLYPHLLSLIEAQPSTGIRDLLLARARDVLGTTIRAMRRDLRALAEVRSLEAMAARPTRSPRRQA